ncbi:hypothetical protein [Sphingomonas sp. CCH9-E2]|nr:hypothetical protein [Sphingomonas sp. CCH9-E2]
MNEVLRRLTDAQTRKLARSVKLDPDQAVPSPLMQASRPQPLEGEIDFDITIMALGNAVTWPAKMLWAGELHGHGLQMQSSLHILIPTREDDPAFLWDGFDYRMLPPAADDRLFELAEEAARSAAASAGKSNP